MNSKKIAAMAARKDELTEAEKIKLANAILKNKKERQTAIAGAINNDNFSLAASIMFNKLKF